MQNELKTMAFKIEIEAVRTIFGLLLCVSEKLNVAFNARAPSVQM